MRPRELSLAGLELLRVERMSRGAKAPTRVGSWRFWRIGDPSLMSGNFREFGHLGPFKRQLNSLVRIVRAHLFRLHFQFVGERGKPTAMLLQEAGEIGTLG